MIDLFTIDSALPVFLSIEALTYREPTIQLAEGDTNVSYLLNPFFVHTNVVAIFFESSRHASQIFLLVYLHPFMRSQIVLIHPVFQHEADVYIFTAGYRIFRCQSLGNSSERSQITIVTFVTNCKK